MTWDKLVAIAAALFGLALLVWIAVGVTFGYPADQPTTASPFVAVPTTGPTPGEAPATLRENTAVPAAATVFGTVEVREPQVIYDTPVPLGTAVTPVATPGR